jgi:hypothetical protein
MQKQDFLSPEQLQRFPTGLSGLVPGEVKKAKVLYILNAISEYHAMRSSVQAFALPRGCLPFTSLLRPTAQMQKIIDAQMQLSKERIRNAIHVWKDDLAGEQFQVDGESISA